MIHPLSYTDQRAQAPRDGTLSGEAAMPGWDLAGPGPSLVPFPLPKDRPEPSLCPPGLLSTLVCYPSSCVMDKETEAQTGGLALPGHRAGWLGAWPGLEIRSPDFPSGPLFIAAGLWAERQGPPPGSGWSTPAGSSAGTSPSPGHAGPSGSTARLLC